jgi:AraC-like DNA-binding protein
LYDFCVVHPHPPDHVRAWRPPVPGVSEVFHASFPDHAYPAHAHGTWTLFLVDDGVVSYDLDRHPHGSTPAVVTVLPPHVVHDGRAATSRGFRKRVIYLEAGVLGERLIGPAVDQPLITDRALRERLSAAHHLLRDPDDAFEAEARLAFIVERLSAHLHARAAHDGHPPGNSLAEQLRALLDARITEPVTLASAGRALGVGAAHLVRTFTRTFGIPPHAYVLGRRVELARARLLDGQPPADVAAHVGFYDQSHFTRHFKRHVGTTPGRYATGRGPV